MSTPELTEDAFFAALLAASADELGDRGFSVASRYTHVFVRGHDETWLLASAQGTPIAAAA